MNDNFFSNLIGQDGIKFSISLDMVSITYLAVAAILVGTIIALISKKAIK